MKRDKVTKRKTNEEFIEEAKEKHGDTYDYSLVDYKNQLTKVKIICREHGVFEQIPKIHLKGSGCPICKREHQSQRQSEYQKKNAYGKKHIQWTSDTIRDRIKDEYSEEKWDLSEIEYKSSSSKLKIICREKDNFGNEHGVFYKTTATLFRQHSECPKCREEKMRKLFSLGKDSFIEKAEEKHGKGRYDYSLVDYKNNATKVKIVCHQIGTNGKEHGVFEQTPANHLKNRGCPLCKEDGHWHASELFRMLEDEFQNEEIVREYRDKEILGNQAIDFYFPKYKIGIEYQGLQHFRPLKFFGGVDKFPKIRERDLNKYNVCKENGILLLYFTFDKNEISEDFFDDVIYEFQKLKDIILRKINKSF